MTMKAHRSAPEDACRRAVGFKNEICHHQTPIASGDRAVLWLLGNLPNYSASKPRSWRPVPSSRRGLQALAVPHGFPREPLPSLSGRTPREGSSLSSRCGSGGTHAQGRRAGSRGRSATAQRAAAGAAAGVGWPVPARRRPLRGAVRVLRPPHSPGRSCPPSGMSVFAWRYACVPVREVPAADPYVVQPGERAYLCLQVSPQTGYSHALPAAEVKAQSPLGTPKLQGEDWGPKSVCVKIKIKIKCAHLNSPPGSIQWDFKMQLN